MLVTNKYSKYYHALCEKARARGPIDGYTEKHHIIPRSLGGSSDRSNLVTFTAREHYIAHMLLVKCTQGHALYKMINAWFRMSHHSAKYINSRSFERARLSFKRTAGWATRGKTYEEIYGDVKAQVLRDHRSESKRAERKGKTWEQIFGKETADRMKIIRGRQSSAWNKGRHHSDHTKQLIREAAHQRRYEKVLCGCGRRISSHNLKKHLRSCEIGN